MPTVKEKINAMKGFPTCAHISPPYIAGVLEEMNKARIVNLGVFSLSKDGEDAAADISICADETISMIVFAVNHDTWMETVVIFQTVHENMCSQLYLKNAQKAQRGIFFTDSTRTQFREIGNWA